MTELQVCQSFRATCCKCGSVEYEIHFFVDSLLYDEPRVKYKLIETHGNKDSTTQFVVEKHI